MENLKDKLKALPKIKVFVEQKAELILKDLRADFEQKHPEIELIESGTHLMHLEDISYRRALFNTALNNQIKKMLPHFCEGEDLDHFVFAFYGGEQRHLGEEPTAPYSFELEEPMENDVIVPKGFVLTSSSNEEAFLTENVVIKAGELKQTGIVKLDKKVKQSEVKTETPLSTFPYVIKIEALEEFTGGSNKETDEEFFERAVLSLYKYSTAGSEKAYIYFTKLSDERVFDVKVDSPEPLKIDLYILPSVEDAVDEIVKKVEAVHANDKVQSFCDVVSVKVATKKEVILRPKMHLLDLSLANDVLEDINENFQTKYKIAQNLPYSKVIKSLEVANVYEVELDKEDTSVQPNEYLDIKVIPSFIEASL